MRKNKGITLIALVVTIVILIILAGVSINVLFGDNGIIQRAREAKALHEQASKEEEKLLNLIEIEMEEMITGEVQARPTQDTTPGVLVGTGTEEDPFLIESIEDLAAFIILTNTGTYGDVTHDKEFTGEYIKLVNTLDFNYDGSYSLEDSLKSGGLKEYFNSGNLTNGSINNVNQQMGSTYFKGIFDGNGNTIKNFYMKDAYSALFGLIGGTIKDLNVISNIEAPNTDQNSVILSGLTLYNTGRIENCKSVVNVKSNVTSNNTIYIGGIASLSTGTISNCESKIYADNFGTSTGSCSVGGITGYNLGTLKNSKSVTEVRGDLTKIKSVAIGGISGGNNATIVDSEAKIIIDGTIYVGNVGGVVGRNDGTVNKVMAVNDINISVTKGSRIGGIAGYNGNTKAIMNAVSMGNIKHEIQSAATYSSTAGIVGYTKYDVNNVISYTNLETNSKMSSSVFSVGGIVGEAYTEATEKVKIINCYSTGKVSVSKEGGSTDRIGSVVGIINNGQLQYSYTDINYINLSSNVKAYALIGGIANSIIKDCKYKIGNNAQTDNAIGEQSKTNSIENNIEEDINETTAKNYLNNYIDENDEEGLLEKW